jgi:hypothetical protein
MATTTIKKIYSDIDLSFNRNPVTGDVTISYDEQAVLRSVRNLLLTNRYERLFQPNVGSNLTGLLFENTGPEMESVIATEIQNCITNYEPRVSLDFSTDPNTGEQNNPIVVRATPDENGYNVTLRFYIANNTTPTTLNLLLKRTR